MNPEPLIPEQLQIRIHGGASLPALIYLPGLHGDWTLVSSFRAAVVQRVRFVEFTYPRTLTWSLADYARAIEDALLADGIAHGWLLAESFGSQVGWLIGGGQTDFRMDGIILAGGFVQHPVRWGVRLAGQFNHCLSMRWMSRFLKVYAQYARFRHRHAPETRASIAEFVARRTDLDRRAIGHRLGLIAGNDPRPKVKEIRQPVYYLAGFVDPLVPWCYVRTWLRRNCPGYRGGKTIWRADHNVLATAPQAAAEVVVNWMGLEEGRIRRSCRTPARPPTWP